MSLLNRQETAKHLRQCARTIDYLTANGELPHIRIGRRVLYRMQDLEEFIERKLIRSVGWKSRKAATPKTKGGQP